MLTVSAGQYLSFYAFFININLLNGSISKYMMLYWLPVFSLELGYQTGATNTKTVNKQKNKYQIHFSYSYVYLGSPILDRVTATARVANYCGPIFFFHCVVRGLKSASSGVFYFGELFKMNFVCFVTELQVQKWKN